MFKTKVSEEKEIIVERLDLAYREINEINPQIVARFGATVKELDLSNNNLEKDLLVLEGFVVLNTLVLDGNKINSHTLFPSLPRVHTLWVNSNQINNLSIFIDKLVDNMPNLRTLSMLKNEACPNYFNGHTLKEYKDYRAYVVSRLKNLQTLDSSPVTDEDHQHATRVYGSLTNLTSMSNTSSTNITKDNSMDHLVEDDPKQKRKQAELDAKQEKIQKRKEREERREKRRINREKKSEKRLQKDLESKQQKKSTKKVDNDDFTDSEEEKDEVKKTETTTTTTPTATENDTPNLPVFSKEQAPISTIPPPQPSRATMEASNLDADDEFNTQESDDYSDLPLYKSPASISTPPPPTTNTVCKRWYLYVSKIYQQRDQISISARNYNKDQFLNKYLKHQESKLVKIQGIELLIMGPCNLSLPGYPRVFFKNLTSFSISVKNDDCANMFLNEIQDVIYVAAPTLKKLFLRSTGYFSLSKGSGIQLFGQTLRNPDLNLSYLHVDIRVHYMKYLFDYVQTTGPDFKLSLGYSFGHDCKDIQDFLPNPTSDYNLQEYSNTLSKIESVWIKVTINLKDRMSKELLMGICPNLQFINITFQSQVLISYLEHFQTVTNLTILNSPIGSDYLLLLSKHQQLKSLKCTIDQNTLHNFNLSIQPTIHQYSSSLKFPNQLTSLEIDFNTYISPLKKNIDESDYDGIRKLFSTDSLPYLENLFLDLRFPEEQFPIIHTLFNPVFQFISDHQNLKNLNIFFNLIFNKEQFYSCLESNDSISELTIHIFKWNNDPTDLVEAVTKNSSIQLFQLGGNNFSYFKKFTDCFYEIKKDSEYTKGYRYPKWVQY
eukprot:gene1241-1565_t